MKYIAPLLFLLPLSFGSIEDKLKFLGSEEFLSSSQRQRLETTHWTQSLMTLKKSGDVISIPKSRPLNK